MEEDSAKIIEETENKEDLNEIESEESFRGKQNSQINKKH